MADEPNIDRNDPRYKRIKSKLSRWMLMANMWAMSTSDGDDDEVVAILQEFFVGNFDRIWAIRHPKK